jgi:hypothetical protein
VREHDFHFGTISDTNEISSDEGAGSDGFESTDVEEKPARKKGDRASTKRQGTPSLKGVPAPCHKWKSSCTSMGSELVDYLALNAEYMQYMMKSDHEHMKIQQKHENRQDKKEAAGVRAAQVEARVRNEREVLENEAMPDDMKEVARKVLLDYFTNVN